MKKLEKIDAKKFTTLKKEQMNSIYGGSAPKEGCQNSSTVYNDGTFANDGQDCW